jgi:catabolite repression HPr-like protein
MIEKVVKVKLQEGMEAAALLVQTACQYKSNIQVLVDGKTVNAKSIMGVMMLSMVENESIRVVANGEDEEEAIQGVAAVLSSEE